MFGIAIGCFGESTFPEVWVRRNVIPPMGESRRLQWVPAWHYYNDLKLAAALAPFSFGE